MPKLTLAGHSLHTILNDLPLGMLPFSLAMDVAYAATGHPSYADAAYYSLTGGYLGLWAAGAAGAADYLELPSGSHSKEIANLHAGLNLGLLGLTTINLFARRHRRAGTLPLFLSALGTAGLFASAWYGGHLVFEHGVRVKGKSPIENAPEAKLPGDEKIVEALSKAGKVAPEQGAEAG